MSYLNTMILCENLEDLVTLALEEKAKLELRYLLVLLLPSLA
jgi:hypothetical protein